MAESIPGLLKPLKIRAQMLLVFVKLFLWLRKISSILISEAAGKVAVLQRVLWIYFDYIFSEQDYLNYCICSRTLRIVLYMYCT
jgi:hypothetical protein